MLEKERAIEKINTLVSELEQLEYSTTVIETYYKKWERKALRYIVEIFSEHSNHVNEYIAIHFYCYNSYGDCDNEELFNSSKVEMKFLLESFIEEIEESETIFDFKEKEKLQMDKSKIFIVHGHDGEIKAEVARFIEKLGLEAIILHEQANGGITSILDKIEKYSNVGYGIVLYTECDVGAKKDEDVRPRARQNVVFEHGYLIGKLGKENVAHISSSEIEMPNDISGTVYIDKGTWEMDIAKELKSAGFDIDFNKVI